MKKLRIDRQTIRDSRSGIIAKYLVSGLAIGMLVGVMLSLYRWLVHTLQGKMQGLYTFGRQSIGQGLLVLALVLVFGLIVGLLTQKERMIGGSGIPQVAGQLKYHMKMNWRTILPFKFFGGLIALASGLTVGREGPSIQMGASVGQAFGELGHFDEKDNDIFLTAGAPAGLSAAFNAPISGLLFVLEELHQSFDKVIVITAIAAALMADYMSALFLGFDPVISVTHLPDVPLDNYIYLILLGVLMGLVAPIFTRGIAYGKSLYAKVKVPVVMKVVLPFVVTAALILVNADLFGSGEHFIFLPVAGNLPVSTLSTILVIKFVLLLIAFCSGMPGGIFLPMLVFGSLVGNIYGQVLHAIGLVPIEAILVFSMLAMCANLAAIARSPITAIMLLLELTGSFTYFLPIGVVVLAAYIVIELINIEPLYEMLLKFMYEPTSHP